MSNTTRNTIDIDIALLTLPKVLRDNSKRFPAVSLIDVLDIAISNMTSRLLFPDKRYQSIEYDTSPIFLYCLQNYLFYFLIQNILHLHVSMLRITF